MFVDRQMAQDRPTNEHTLASWKKEVVIVPSTHRNLIVVFSDRYCTQGQACSGLGRLALGWRHVRIRK